MTTTTMPTFSTDEILWYDNGKWGDAGYAVANPNGKTWTNNSGLQRMYAGGGTVDLGCRGPGDRQLRRRRAAGRGHRGLSLRRFIAGTGRSR